jgi:outer membrane protein OmpA-like peptidoglycan-associated protein
VYCSCAIKKQLNRSRIKNGVCVVFVPETRARSLTYYTKFDAYGTLQGSKNNIILRRIVMNMVRNHKRLFAALGVSAVLLSGCSTINPYTGQTQTSDATIGTGVGALGGAAIGAIAGGGRGALIGGAVGALTGGLIGNHMDQENEELRQRLVGTGVQVTSNGNYIQLMMASDVTFATGQADIRSDFYPALDSVAIVLKKYNGTNIVVTGFTDNVGNAAYNQTLSENRAASVGNYLMSQGINPSRVFTEGRGMRNPIASNASAQGRAMNRRVVITLRPR